MQVPSLPVEVIVHIFSHLPKFTLEWHETYEDLESADIRNGTLFAASLVSRLWSSAAYEALYGDIAFHWRTTTATAMLASFEQHPDLHALVRRVSADRKSVV